MFIQTCEVAGNSSVDINDKNYLLNSQEEWTLKTLGITLEETIPQNKNDKDPSIEICDSNPLYVPQKK